MTRLIEENHRNALPEDLELLQSSDRLTQLTDVERQPLRRENKPFSRSTSMEDLRLPEKEAILKAAEDLITTNPFYTPTAPKHDDTQEFARKLQLYPLLVSDLTETQQEAPAQTTDSKNDGNLVTSLTATGLTEDEDNEKHFSPSSAEQFYEHIEAIRNRSTNNLNKLKKRRVSFSPRREERTYHPESRIDGDISTITNRNQESDQTLTRSGSP